MNIVSWNCRDDFASKISALLSLQPDVAIVSEVRRAALERLPATVSHTWVGPERGRGLPILGVGEWRVSSSGPLHGNWFAPFVAEASGRFLRGVGVWTETCATAYQVTAERAVGEMLRSAAPPMLVAGDLNLSESADPRRLVGCRVNGVAAALSGGGLSSAWHSRLGEAFGAESEKTYFHYRRKERGFHIDYIFLDAPRLAALKRIGMGSFDEWVARGLSDHVPLTAEIEDKAVSI